MTRQLLSCSSTDLPSNTTKYEYANFRTRALRLTLDNPLAQAIGDWIITAMLVAADYNKGRKEDVMRLGHFVDLLNQLVKECQRLKAYVKEVSTLCPGCVSTCCPGLRKDALPRPVQTLLLRGFAV
jgi:hypothetical protein